MRVNVYAEEMTDRVELVDKVIDGQRFVGVRFYLELPVTIPWTSPAADLGKQISGPFLHREGDDDSAAVTFWGKKKLRAALVKALALLDARAEETTPSQWTDTATELECLQKVVRNLNGDPDQIARYLVERLSVYVGWGHENVAREMIAKALSLVRQKP